VVVAVLEERRACSTARDGRAGTRTRQTYALRPASRRPLERVEELDLRRLTSDGLELATQKNILLGHVGEDDLHLGVVFLVAQDLTHQLCVERERQCRLSIDAAVQERHDDDGDNDGPATWG